jgi:hydroxyacylglutathione hydrolase
MTAPFTHFDPVPGLAEQIAPGLRRVLAPNPSPMTFRGTNTYLLGSGAVTVIDPGPQDDRHLAAIHAALGPDERIVQILVTHAHSDHAPLARPLAAQTGAPVLAYGDARAGRRARPVDTDIGGGEGVDSDFAPDQTLADGAVIDTSAGPVMALWTPGHFGNHLSFAWRGALFSGDLVMGWASSLISPPDGDLGDYMRSLARLAARADQVYYPGHGAPVTDPAARVADLAHHRRTREAEIVAALSQGPADIAALTRSIYHDTPAALHRAAARNVLAHLIDLTSRGLVSKENPATSSPDQPPIYHLHTTP